jgi:hypothetical protein
LKRSKTLVFIATYRNPTGGAAAAHEQRITDEHLRCVRTMMRFGHGRSVLPAMERVVPDAWVVFANPAVRRVAGQLVIARLDLRPGVVGDWRVGPDGRPLLDERKHRGLFEFSRAAARSRIVSSMDLNRHRLRFDWER